MLTENEKNQVFTNAGNLRELPSDLRVKLIDSLKKKEYPFSDAQDDICCDLGIDPPDRYQRTSSQNCSQLGGTIVSSSNCGF